jgi:hypothetical protein
MQFTEAPDLEGYSNADKWETLEYGMTNYKMPVTKNVYVWLILSEGLDNFYSSVFYLQLKGTIPIIEVADTLFCEGSTVTLSATPADLGAGNYQWSLNSELLSGQTAANLTIDQPGTYQVKALSNPTECPGLYYPSQPLTMHYIKPVVYAAFKPDLNRVTLSTAIDYQSYQWYQVSATTGDELINGATLYRYNANLTAETKYYAVSITTQEGCTAMSDPLLVNDSVYSVPEIKTNVADLYCRNESLVLALKNQAYASYQWMKNGNNIWGATQAKLNVQADYETGTGLYAVKVTYANDTTTQFTSAETLVTFSPQPYVVIKDDAKPCLGGQIELNTHQGWSGPTGGFDEYSWFVNDENNLNEAVLLNQATDSALLVNVPAFTRYYWAITRYGNCIDTSAARVVSPFELYQPYISMDPWDGLICMGDTVNLKIYDEEVACRWFIDGMEISGETTTSLVATKGGAYTVEISSTVCENTLPVMSVQPATINYRVAPEFTISPEGEIFNNNPDHRIFCTGESITLSVENADHYTNYQWIGKLFDPTSDTDDWEELGGQTEPDYTFVNGVDNVKLHFKIRVDSLMDNGEVCTGLSRYKTVDGWVFQSPAIESRSNAELCHEDDSTLLNVAFHGTWVKYEWTVDGDPVPNSNNDSIYAKQEGEWVVICYPEKCPDIPHSSGVGPYVRVMPQAEIWENDTVIFAMPEEGFYSYQWYFNGIPMDMSTIEIPWVLYKSQLESGEYQVEVTNPRECTSLSEPYIVSSVPEDQTVRVEVYPNPAIERLNILIDQAIPGTRFELFDMQGKKVFESRLDQSFTLDVTVLQNGLYFYQVTSTQQVSKGSVVIEHP